MAPALDGFSDALKVDPTKPEGWSGLRQTGQVPGAGMNLGRENGDPSRSTTASCDDSSRRA